MVTFTSFGYGHIFFGATIKPTALSETCHVRPLLSILIAPSWSISPGTPTADTLQLASLASISAPQQPILLTA